MISISIGQRKLEGQSVKKDTLQNIEQCGEFVVNISTVDMLDAVNQTSAEYPPGVSEAEQTGLTLVPSDIVAVPRVKESPVHFECKLDRVVMCGRPAKQGLVIGEVVRFHIADRLWDEDVAGADVTKLDPLSRLGGTLYASIGDVLSRARPKPPERA